MSIATDIEVNWNGTVDSSNKIGLSKPFTELPSDVWADDSAFITAYDNPAAKFTKVSDGYPTCPVKSNDCPWYLTGGIGYSNINHNSDSIYLRSAIICVPDDFVYNTWNGNQGGRIRNNINNFRIVTSMSTSKNGVDVSLTVQDGTVVGAQYVLKETLTGSSSNGGITIGAGTYILMIVDIYTVDGNYYLNIPYSLPGFVYDTNNGDGVMGMWAYDSSVNKMFSLSPQIFPTDDGRISITGGAVYNVNTWNRHELPAVEGDENLIFCASYIPWNWYLSLSGNVHYHLLAVSRFGLKFNYNNDNYKPIIAQGVVTGYTTDMTVPSDFDNWTDISGHNISPTPPSPTPPSEDDSYADMGIGVGTGVGGYTSFAIMTKADLVDLLADFNANLEDGMSVVNNFICLYKLGPLASSLCSTRVGNIIMSANASANFVSIRADYNIVTSQKNVITLGSYDVPRMTNTFYDFAPYSTYELFIPCCGWVPLPDTVAGRQITVYMIIDLASCTCKGVCRIGGTTVAEASGVLGVSVPFFSTDSGIKRAADLMAVTQMISGLAQGAVGAGAGAGALVVSGSANALQGLEQLYINGNTNYTAIKGGNGDITAVGNGEYCTIKITHPKVDEVVNNSKFGHSVGYLCNTVDKIKNFKGLTICANPHVNGIDCTESEKEEIKRLLEEGIIVN